MAQALLSDRFKLTFDYEERAAEVFDLAPARGGPKLRKALPEDVQDQVSTTAHYPFRAQRLPEWQAVRLTA